ncbi:MAG: hypothetical protein KGR99_11905, partial [Betaproteobacteria bacterium]|nr:hypothetical protein [Betaproteobacteria bacterium]
MNDILKWSQSELKLWQQDALRRLLVSPESALTDQDWDDLYVLLRAEHGLPNPRQLEAAPLSAEDLPANPGAVAPV